MKNLLIFLFITTFCIVPWAIGGTYPFTRTCLLAAVVVLALGLLIHSIRESSGGALRSKVAFPKIGWLLLLGIAFTFFQASGHSGWLQSQLPVGSSENAGVRVSQTEDGGNGEDGFVGAISVYPPATRQRLIGLLIPVSFFLIAALLFDDKNSIVKAFAALTALGVLLSGFGIVQKLSFQGAIYGIYELLFGGDPFGPFVNGNNAAGFLLLPLATGAFFVAKMLINHSRQGRSGKKSKQTLMDDDWFGESEPKQSFGEGLLGVVAELRPQHLYFLSAMVLMVAGVIMTMSRGGMVALLVQSVVVLILIARSNWKLSLAVALTVMVGGLSLIIYLDQSSAVKGEIESLSEISSAATVRLAHWEDATRFGLENWVFGVGNGTYRYVSPKFQSFYFPRVFHHAESVFVETFVELGAVGLLLIVGCLVFTVYYLVVLLRRAETFDKALGVAGVGCLAGQVTTAFLDFGLYQTPNSIVLATVMGIVAGQACRSPSSHRDNQQQPASNKLKGLLRIAVISAVALLAIANLRESYAVESTRMASRKLEYFNHMKKRADAPKRISLKPFEIKSLLDTASSIRPDDSGVHALMGALKISQARVLQAEVTQEALNEQINITEQELAEFEASMVDAALINQTKSSLEQLQGIEPGLVWSLTAPTAFHQRLRRAQRKSKDTAADVFEDPEVVTLLSDAYQEYRTAYQLCPLLTESQMKLAQLSGFAGEDLEKELEHINKALELSVTDTQILYKCGFLALNSGEQKLAVSLWGKCLRNPHLKVHERGIIALSIQELPMQQLYEQVLPQNPHELIRIATRYFSGPELTLPKKLLLAHITKVIDASPNLSDLEENLLLAQVAYQDGEFETAIKYFKLALEQNPEKVPWRMNYARALIEANEFDEAMRQLKICQLNKDLRQNQVLALINKIRRSR